MELSTSEAETRLAELMAVAQVEPVRIFKDQRPYAVLFSNAEYAALMACKIRLIQLENELEKLQQQLQATKQKNATATASKAKQPVTGDS